MELPSIQWGIKTQYDSSQVFVGAINASSSESWLRTYKASNAMSMSLMFDPEKTVTNLYQVGDVFNNIPPTYIIIDKNGIVRYRTDNKLNRTGEMKYLIDQLLLN